MANTMRRIAALSLPELFHVYGAAIALRAMMAPTQRAIAAALEDLSDAIEAEIFTRAADGDAEIGAALQRASQRATADLKAAGIAAALNPSAGGH